jgi:outer membrane protein
MTHLLRTRMALSLLACSLGASSDLFAQTPAPQRLTLQAAVELAIRNYPALQESRARAEAANRTVAVAETAYLPRLDALLQVNRATHNNVFGLLLPQAVIPSISGPVLGTRDSDSVWGTAAGVLLSWEAIDFGVRKANVDAARRQTDAARAQAALTELDVAAAAADAFLTVLAAEESVRAAQANVDRLKVLTDAITALVRAELRPGADESRAVAELALARNQLSLAVEQREIAVATLSSATGTAGTDITLDPFGLLQLPAAAPMVAALESHPAVRADAAALEVVRARERAVERAFLPRVSLQGAFSGRGSEAEVPGVITGASAFRVPNWALGAVVTFPVFDIFSANARRSVEEQNELAARSRQEQTRQNIATAQSRARALVNAASEIANNTPVARAAALEAASRARARYDAGLASVTEVAEAQRLLAQAEADNAVARLSMWRALLAAAQASGDLRPFLSQLTP